jgi:hypothetical protein
MATTKRAATVKTRRRAIVSGRSKANQPGANAKPPTAAPNAEGGPAALAAGLHAEREDHPWEIAIPDHPQRSDSKDYIASRTLMNNTAAKCSPFFYGNRPWQDHHGGGLWLKDKDGWFMVMNVAGMEWSSQFCADPKKVDQLRLNARRLYAGFPNAVKELGIRALLDTPITDAIGIARWTDSICNASIPLPAPLHTGILPQGGGVHHYPWPVVAISLFKHDDFKLWVVDGEGQPAAVAPTSPRGMGDGRVQLLYSTPNSALNRAHMQAAHAGQTLVLPEDHPLARQAYRNQVPVSPAEPATLTQATVPPVEPARVG